MNDFEKQGFAIIRGLYDVNNHTLMYPSLLEYFKGIAHTGVTDTQSPKAPAFYKNTELNKVHIRLLRKMEEITGLELYPTYVYARLYNNKSTLAAHTDRPACEISVTLNLGYEGDYNWPIWIRDPQGKDHCVNLEPGDGLIYRGCELTHWREPADDRVLLQAQAFFHFVDQHGLYDDLVLDLVKRG